MQWLAVEASKRVMLRSAGAGVDHIPSAMRPVERYVIVRSSSFSCTALGLADFRLAIMIALTRSEHEGLPAYLRRSCPIFMRCGRRLKTKFRLVRHQLQCSLALRLLVQEAAGARCRPKCARPPRTPCLGVRRMRSCARPLLSVWARWPRTPVCVLWPQ